MEDLISLENGKYKFYTVDGVLKCDRYDKPWRDIIGDKAVYALYEELMSVKQCLVLAERLLGGYK